MHTKCQALGLHALHSEASNVANLVELDLGGRIARTHAHCVSFLNTRTTVEHIACNKGGWRARRRIQRTLAMMRLQTVCLGLDTDLAITISPRSSGRNRCVSLSSSTISPSRFNVGSMDGPTHLIVSPACSRQNATPANRAKHETTTPTSRAAMMLLSMASPASSSITGCELIRVYGPSAAKFGFRSAITKRCKT